MKRTLTLLLLLSLRSAARAADELAVLLRTAVYHP
jgi:hypothetical protein